MTLDQVACFGEGDRTNLCRSYVEIGVMLPDSSKDIGTDERFANLPLICLQTCSLLTAAHRRPRTGNPPDPCLPYADRDFAPS
jgi:hypothetical protein